MKIGFNLAMVCIMTVICIAAVAITALARGLDGTIVSLAFTALGAIPAGLITWGIMKVQKNNVAKKKESE